MIIIGVDPGQNGGLASISSEHAIDAIPMPIAGKDIDIPAITKWLFATIGADSCEVYIEDVHAMPGQGVTSMFSFGFSLGIIHGIFAALNIPRYKVAPLRWKKELGIAVDVKGMTSAQKTVANKWAAMDFCSRVYPTKNLVLGRGRKPHSGMVDALCIATYGLRVSK